MRKLITAILAICAIFSLQARKLEPWQDPNIFEENRLPMRATFTTDQQQTLSLNGRWRFHGSPSVESRLIGFEAIAYNDASWREMPVPGMWQLNGFGDPVYVNIGYAWKGLAPNTPPLVPEKGNYVGQYRRVFDLDASWEGKPVYLCIGSATSNVRVWINGKMVGYSEDSKLEARFNVTPFVRTGQNVIAMEVFRWCDGSYLEDQDFWRLSGIARGVYLYTREKHRLEDVHILADADGNLTVQAEVTSGIDKVNGVLADSSGHPVASFSAPVKKGRALVREIVDGVQPWSAEIPYLYTLKVSACNGAGEVVESTTFDVGFRTVEMREGQLLVNGRPVLIKGVNRHELSSVKGYVVSEADMLRDIRIMKELNINAVRTCHYPDDPLWLSLCDRYGLYVVDEGNIESHGMGYKDGETLAQDPQFRAAHLVRDQRMVQRDFNHPSVIIWSLGNEAGAGPNFVDSRDWIKAYDPSRPVQYERALGTQYDCSDIMCPMYADPAWCEEYVSAHPARPLIQCEYAHAMGNSMGGFKDYWDLVRKYPSYQGGFIWDFQDQALWNGKFYAFGGDYTTKEPSDGSFNCNGVIAADRSLHPHAYEVRYQYRNILTSGTPEALEVHNEFFFRDLSEVRLLWTLEADGVAVRTGVVEKLSVKPQESNFISLGLGSLEDLPGTLTLTVRYVLKRAWPLLPAGSEIAYDQFLLRDRRPVMLEAEGGKVGVYDSSATLVLSGTTDAAGTAGERKAVWTASFNKKTGALSSYTLERKELLSAPLMPCFNRAPVENDLGAGLQFCQGLWRNPAFAVKDFTFTLQDGSCLVEVEYAPIGGAALVSLFYYVAADGSLSVVESMVDAGNLSGAPDLFRFGMRFAMPEAYNTVDFFGLGPWENYCDRNSAALLGRYKQKVADQYHFGYVRTQESGTHTGLRFFRVLDGDGNGLEVASAVDFSASALPFSLEQLDVAAPEGDTSVQNRNGQYGIPRHSLELKPSGSTHVHVDALQMGVGCVNSWGALPLESYRIPAAEREFRFVLRPVVNL